VTKRIAVLALAVLALLAPTPAEAKTRIQYRYVQPQFDSGPVAYLSRFDTPAGRVAPTGNFVFTPAGRSFNMTVNDVAARRGDTVFIWVLWQDGTEFAGCVKDNVSRQYFGSSAGWVFVRVASELPGYGGDCSVGPVAGTVTVSF
jgi:hypothetical protein